jgi:hypothetical protein
MTKDAALKMAIEALEEAREQLGGLPQLEKLIQDCKEALGNLEKDYSFSRTNKESSLVQSAQEPDYWLGYGLQAYDEKPHDDATPVYLRPAPQSAQEPVAWTDEYKMYLEWDKDSLCDKAVCKEHEAIALYTHPAQPLDIEILNNLYDMAEERDGDAFDFDHIKFARAIEKAHGIAVNDG